MASPSDDTGETSAGDDERRIGGIPLIRLFGIAHHEPSRGNFAITVHGVLQTTLLTRDHMSNLLKTISRTLAICSLLIPAVLAGCGGSDRESVYPTTGTLTMGDEAFGPTLIHLVPTNTDEGRMVVGEVDEQGKTTFTTYERGDGAPAGEYRVLVAMKMEAPPRPFPKIYRDPKSSPLVVTIEESDENDLAMKIDPNAGPMLGSQEANAAEKMSAAQGDLMNPKTDAEE